MSTSTVLLILAATSALLVLGIMIALVRRRAEAFATDNLPADYAVADRESCADYYRPMTRMLDPRELSSAQSLQGMALGDFARFRRARIAAFRRYLADMRTDFRRIEFKLHYALLSASHDEADLVHRLNQQKSRFRLQLLRVQYQLVLFRFGFGSIDVEPLLEMLQQFESSLVRRPALN